MAVGKQRKGPLILSNENKSYVAADNIASSKNESKRSTRRSEEKGDKESTFYKDASKSHRKFSLKDDLAIIRFLLECSRNTKADGREIWLKMSSQKVTKHSWLEMKDRYMKVIQPKIDKYPIQKEDVKKLRSCPSDNRRRRNSSSPKYQLLSCSSDRNLIAQDFSKRSDKDDYVWSPIKRRRSGDGQHNSPEKNRNLASGSSTGDLVAGVALKAQPKYRRLKVKNLQLKVIKLDNEKCNVKTKTVRQQCDEMLDKSEKVSDTCQKEAGSDDLRLRVALLSDDVSSNESAEEQLDTAKEGNKGKCIPSSSRSRRAKKSRKAESPEPNVPHDSNQTDTSASEEIFSVDETSRTSLPTQGSSRQLEPSKDTGATSPTAATSDEHHPPAVLPLENGESNVLHTNCIKNFILSDSQSDNCFEVDNTEKTEDLVVKYSEETDTHLLVCERLMTWLNVSPEVFAQAVLMNNGNVDDGVHWLLFSKTASGNAVWDSKDDKDLLDGDEEVYKLLEEKYGETLILKRQQFLAMNALPLNV